MLPVLNNSDAPGDFIGQDGTSREFGFNAPVPEPATFVLFAIGMTIFAGVGRENK